MVAGTRNLFIANASIMPEFRAPTSTFPTIMIAERIAGIVRQRVAA
jgi:choline dehydrogenase-like flavoprotein